MADIMVFFNSGKSGPISKGFSSLHQKRLAADFTFFFHNVGERDPLLRIFLTKMGPSELKDFW